jgi:uncharacterized protein (DUF983 family)
MTSKAPLKVVCPNCSGAGYVFIPDEKGARRHMLCGHSVCQQAAEERIAAHVMREIMRHLPPAPKAKR